MTSNLKCSPASWHAVSRASIFTPHQRHLWRWRLRTKCYLLQSCMSDRLLRNWGQKIHVIQLVTIDGKSNWSISDNLICTHFIFMFSRLCSSFSRQWRLHTCPQQHTCRRNCHWTARPFRHCLLWIHWWEATQRQVNCWSGCQGQGWWATWCHPSVTYLWKCWSSMQILLCPLMRMATTWWPGGEVWLTLEGNYTTVYSSSHCTYLFIIIPKYLLIYTCHYYLYLIPFAL